MNFTWKRQTGRYTNGKNLYLNKVLIGSVFWDSGSPPVNENGEKLYYKTSILLPQATKVGSFLTEEEAKSAVENSVNGWFIHVNKEV